MNKKHVIILLLLSITFQQLFSQTIPAISKDSLSKHVYFLASDELQGRNTGSKAQYIAADYIAEYFKQFGLIPAGNSEENQYFQEFMLFRYGVFYKFPSYNDQNLTRQPTAGDNFFYFSAKSNANRWYKETVCSLPQNCCGNSDVFRFLMTNDLTAAIDSVRLLYQECNNRKFFVLLPEVEMRQIAQEKPGFNSILYKLNGEIKLLQHGKTGVYAENNKFNLAYDFANEIPDVELILISTDFLRFHGYQQNTALEFDSLNFSLFKGRIFDTIRTQNVVGFIEGGSDKEQAIVIGAHYDHLGTNEKGIFNGADDNASGTATLIELARHFSAAKLNGELDGRSILFIAFSAEEKGLLGSEVYVQFPFFPIDSTVFMLNMDMIGRPAYPTDKKGVVYYAAFGHDKNKLKSVVRLSGRKAGNIKAYKHSGILNSLLWRYGSDHDRFLKRGVTSIVFFTGLHKDYHKTTDTAEKIDYINLSKIAALVYLSAHALANDVNK